MAGMVIVWKMTIDGAMTADGGSWFQILTVLGKKEYLYGSIVAVGIWYMSW